MVKKQQEIIKLLHVTQEFDIENEINLRINFLKNYLRQSKNKVYVLGISGGVDSTVAGRLAKLAVESLRNENYPARFIAMRLPYGVQKDEADAKMALEFIQPDEILTVNIKASADALLNELLFSQLKFESEKQKDFIFGNIKARQRMVVQYALAGVNQGLVIGTDHAAEALMGFFTKFGDGACDIAPLTGLNKRRIKKIGTFLNAPATLISKCPTADLEDLAPLRPDEEAYGLTYEQIDDFLEGKKVDESSYQIIYQAYGATLHKRQLPITPFII